MKRRDFLKGAGGRPQLSFMVNLQKWNALSEQYRQVFEVASSLSDLPPLIR